MSRKVLGIDIRKESVSAVLVKTSLRESRIDAHAHVPISDSTEDENSIKTALETLCSEIDTDGCDCVISISADHFSYRILQIPFKDSKKIKMVLPFELEPTVPYPVDDLIIEFIDLESVGHNENTEVIVVAVPKTELIPYLGTLGAIKIDPEMVTLSGLPAALCLANQADTGKDQLFLKVDKALSTLFILSNGGIKLIRSFPTPVTDDIRAGSLGAFVHRTLSAFGELSQSEYQPQDMVVTGSGLNGADFDADVARFLDLPVKRLNFSDRMRIPIDGQYNKPWDPALMDNALALALMEIQGIKGLNFHKGRFAAKKFIVKYKKYLIKTGIIAAAVLTLLLFNVIMESYTLNRQIDRFNRQITGIFQETFPEVKRIVDPFQQMQIKVQEVKKSAVSQAATTSQIISIDILNHISKSISESITVDITRMVMSPDNVLISGTTDTFEAVDDIKSKLEQIEAFKKVTISSTNKNRSGKEVRFQMKVAL
jgi:type II secretory pathway component PulL